MYVHSIVIFSYSPGRLSTKLREARENVTEDNNDEREKLKN